MQGRTLSHFEILETLGQGGMGIVYRARDVQLDRFVALKLLPPGRHGDPERRKRFLQEAHSASALNHPNIVTIYEIFEADGLDCLAMEFVAGKTLDQLIPQRGMRVADALKYAIQIADGLSSAHAAGIIHRDLKPTNLIVGDGGRLKVLDFGLARRTELPGAPENTTLTVQARITEEGSIMGTVGYMSPEQAQGLPVDHRSDIFSFGCVLYEMLAGRRPFQGDTKMATIAAIIGEDPKPLSDGAQPIPPALEKLVARCLRKDRDRRMHSMVDIKLALEELKEESESGANFGTGQIVQAKSKGKWPIVAAVAVLAVLCGAGLLYRSRIERKPTTFKTAVLTSYDGIQRYPALSPDGKVVAFSWNGEKQDNFDIYVKLLDAGAPVRITSHPAAEYAPAWSPDGRFLAFVREEAQNEWGYYVVPALGGQERRIDTERNWSAPSWTPDGKALLFVDFRLAPSSIVSVDIESGERRRITFPPPGNFQEVYARVSPDGKMLAVQRSPVSQTAEIRLFPFPPKPEDGGLLLEKLPPDVALDDWSADSRELIVTGNVGGVRTLARVSTAGKDSAPALLPGVAQGAETASVARTGGLLAYSYQIADTSIWRASLHLRSAPERFIASPRRDSQPVYSDDGKTIAFDSERTGEREVWVADADGSNLRQVTRGASGPATPSLSRDGKKVLFANRPGGNVDVYLADVQGGVPRRVTTHPREDYIPHWSRDGKSIYFSSRRTSPIQVWKVPADGGGPEIQVTRNGGWFSCESLDGTLLYYVKGQFGSGLWQMPAAGGPETEILDAAVGAGWTVAGKYIYFLNSSGSPPADHVTLERLDPKTSKREILMPMPRGTRADLGLLAVSPDEQWVLFTRSDVVKNELVLIENFR